MLPSMHMAVEEKGDITESTLHMWNEDYFSLSYRVEKKVFHFTHIISAFHLIF